MAKMRATLRKAAQVTPPPSPKNVLDDIKGHWLRNHSTPKSAVRARRVGRRPRIKKEASSFVVHHDDSVNGRCSRSSTSSPICNGRVRTRSTSEVHQPAGYWGPRRSARLIGIPAELDADEENEQEDEDEEEEEDEVEEEEETEEGDANEVEEKEIKRPDQRVGRSSRSAFCRRRRTATNGHRRNSEGSTPVGDEEDESTCCPSFGKKQQQSPSTPTATSDQNNGICSDHSTAEAAETSPSASAAASASSPCKQCKQRKKGRTIDALLVESERYLQYPSGGSGRTSGCRMRSTYNSRQDGSVLSPRSDLLNNSLSPVRSREEDESNRTATCSLPIPQSVDQVQFSFELVPVGTCWYQTFLRDEAQHNSTEPLPEALPGVSSGPPPFLLPYQMSLEAILKSGRKKKGNPTGARRGPRKARTAAQQDFRPIISTRLQMQSAARLQQSQLAMAAEAASKSAERRRRGGSARNKTLWHLPRKSPRCHASTLAILSSAKSDEEDAPVSGLPCPAQLSPVKEEPAEEPKENDEAATAPDPALVQALEEMLMHDLERKVVRPDPLKKKRGRPRKFPLPDEQVVVADTPLTELLATPLDRIEDIVDERLLLQSPKPELEIAFEDPPDCWTDDAKESVMDDCPVLVPHEPADVFHDLESRSGGAGSRSSSVYETASEIGSNGSTGTCDSGTRKWRRRKRPNMTGWPRSIKKRSKPLPLVALDLHDDDDDDGPPVLSPIREEARNTSGASVESPSRRSGGAYVSKPFQFQRKTLRFCGKRILRPAAQRHAPQRLEYWPCFESASRRRIKKGRKA